MIVITILLILTIVALVLMARRQHKTNEQLYNEITTNSDAVQELESFTYYSESEIKEWIEDGTRDIQYDLDDHGTTIENLNCDKLDIYEFEKLQKTIAEDAENVGVLININTKRITNVIKYLAAVSEGVFKDIEDKKDDKDYNDFLKSFSDMSLWTDARRSEHYKVLALLIDDGNYNTNHQSMGDEIYYKTYCELIGKGDKDGLGNKTTAGN